MEKDQNVIAQMNNVTCGKQDAKQLQDVIFMKKGRSKMDELYKLLINFSFEIPITKKRLLRIKGITTDLIQKALDEGYIVETTPSGIDEIRYLITAKGQKIL